MALRRIKDTEKLTVGALRTAIQTLVAPQLSDIAERLTHVEARLHGIDKRFDVVDRSFDTVEKQIAIFEEWTREVLRSMRNEMEAPFDTVR